MYDLAHPVNVVKTYEALACQLSNKWKRHSFVVVSFNDLKEIHTQNLKNHNKMLSIWTVMDKGIQQLSTMWAFRYNSVLCYSRHQMLICLVIFFNRSCPFVSFPILGDLVENIHLIISSFNIVLGTFLNFQGNVAIEFKILSKPNSREMSPSKFLNDNVSIKQYLSYVDWVITTDFVVRHALILAGVLVLVETLVKNFSERLEILIFHIGELVAMMSITHTCRVILPWLRRFCLIRFLRRFLHSHLNRRIAIFNLIYLGNQTLHVVNLGICGVSHCLTRFEILNWVFGGTWIDLVNCIKLVVKALESVRAVQLILLLSCQILNQRRILIVSVLFFNDIVRLRCF